MDCSAHDRAVARAPTPSTLNFCTTSRVKSPRVWPALHTNEHSEPLKPNDTKHSMERSGLANRAEMRANGAWQPCPAMQLNATLAGC